MRWWCFCGVGNVLVLVEVVFVPVVSSVGKSGVRVWAVMERRRKKKRRGGRGGVKRKFLKLLLFKIL